VDYKDTIQLPRTDFPMKANLAQREPEIQAGWEAAGIYEQVLAQNAARPNPKKFVLHDGPPYANGDIHIGHALNKILKDIIVKYRNQNGEVADYVPGWDCHGLPIELLVDKQLGPKKRELDRATLIGAYRESASKWIDKQRISFKRLGIFGRWETPYATMDRRYEADTVRALARAAERGFLMRGKKPVYWCITDRTALAEAEVEYQEHTSPSIHVAFDLVSPLPDPKLAGRKARLVIWTTTPWTLPANLAIAARADYRYAAYDLGGTVVVVARDLLHAFLTACAPQELDGAELRHPGRLLAELEGKALEGLTYRHPFMERESPVILGQHVTLEAGTGLVHTAPGHGAEDYVVGQQYLLEVLNPVDGAGVFTDGAGRYAGLKIFDANPRIVADLAASGHLLSDPRATLKHSYPHCWRCHKPVVFRATDQWFLKLDHDGMRQKTLAEIDRVTWIPRWGRDRIYNMIENRPDWCLSRQRTWGVPIPVFYCEGCAEPLVSPALMNRVADAFEQEGIEAWYRRDPAEFTAGAACGQCGGTAFRREQDILDVWWDSGVSWAAVAERDPNLGSPVDLYLEGSDQHRGWFHSALLTGMAVRGQAPYRAVLTHGFVLDEQGKAMSKSVGNVVAPEEIIKQHGADVLRLWVSASDYRDDVRIGKEIVAGLAEGYRKIRNTLRYALGATDGFDIARDAVPVAELEPIDRWAYDRLITWQEKVRAGYEGYEFHLAYHATVQLCAVELSSLYFDIVKDRLYTARKDGKARRSAQTVLWYVAHDLCTWLAPILSFTTSEAWGYLPGAPASSVFLAGLPRRERPAGAAALEARYAALFAVREVVQKALENARAAKLIGKSTEAAVTVRASGQQRALLESARAELAGLFIVSKVTLADGPLSAEVAAAPGLKCPRCWVFAEDTGQSAAHPELCGKCVAAIG
jgi:isoleucyl-tRNA synthetase